MKDNLKLSLKTCIHKGPAGISLGLHGTHSETPAVKGIAQQMMLAWGYRLMAANFCVHLSAVLSLVKVIQQAGS